MPPSIAPDEEEAERLTYATGRLTTAQLTMTKMQPVWRRQKSGDRCPAPGFFCGERLCAVISEDAARQGQRCVKRTRAPWSACSSYKCPCRYEVRSNRPHHSSVAASCTNEVRGNESGIKKIHVGF